MFLESVGGCENVEKMLCESATARVSKRLGQILLRTKQKKKKAPTKEK